MLYLLHGQWIVAIYNKKLNPKTFVEDMAAINISQIFLNFCIMAMIHIFMKDILAGSSAAYIPTHREGFVLFQVQ